MFLAGFWYKLIQTDVSSQSHYFETFIVERFLQTAFHSLSLQNFCPQFVIVNLLSALCVPRFSFGKFCVSVSATLSL